MENIMKMFRSFNQIPAQFPEAFENDANRLMFKKGDVIQDAGQLLDQLILIERGFLIGSIFVEGRKQAMWFKKEDECVIQLRSILGEKALGGIIVEALEDTIVRSWAAPTTESWLRHSREFSRYYEEFCLRRSDTGMRMILILDQNLQ